MNSHRGYGWLKAQQDSKPRRFALDYPLLAIILFGLILLIILSSGCARFHTVQIDTSYDGDTQKPARTITTKVSAWTCFSAKSELAKFAATQTDKTQSAKVGSLNQESTETNLFNALGAGIGTALKVYTTGTP